MKQMKKILFTLFCLYNSIDNHNKIPHLNLCIFWILWSKHFVIAINLHFIWRNEYEDYLDESDCWCLLFYLPIIFKCKTHIPASFAVLAFEAQMETHSHYAKGKYTNKINEQHQLRYGQKQYHCRLTSLWSTPQEIPLSMELCMLCITVLQRTQQWTLSWAR